MAIWNAGKKTPKKKGIKMQSPTLPSIFPSGRAVGPSKNPLPASQLTQPVKPGQLPPASIVYGVAASALTVMGIYLVCRGHWVTGLLIILPAAALLGFAMHFLKR